MARLSITAAIASTSIVLTILAACSVEVDLTGKGCPCPDDLVCDTRSNTCVTSVLPSAGDDAGPPPAACNEAECACKTNEDCRDPKRPYCGPSGPGGESGTCVECLGGAGDTCTAGGFCNEKNQCVVGCKGNADCQGQLCNTTTHRCVECVGDGDCTDAGATAKCSPGGRCAESCSGEGTACGTGGTCCGGLCIPTADDVLNCGACGKVCSTTNNAPSCAGGQCTFKCADGFAHCGQPADNTGCETNIRNAQNCGSCGVACSPQTIVFADKIACAGSACTYATCQQGHLDDDENAANGCEATCGGKLERCCPAPQNACNSGATCKVNGTCPNQ